MSFKAFLIVHQVRHGEILHSHEFSAYVKPQAKKEVQKVSKMQGDSNVDRKGGGKMFAKFFARPFSSNSLNDRGSFKLYTKKSKVIRN